MTAINAHLIARGCAYVGASHCAFDAAKIAGAIEVLLHDYPLIEPSLLGAATVCLAWHVVIHHSRFALLLAACHAANLAVGWLHLAVAAELLGHSWQAVLESPAAYVILAVAVIATVVELATPRTARAFVAFRRWFFDR